MIVRAMVCVVLLGALLAGCSEPVEQGDETGSESNTGATIDNAACAGDALLDCARTSTIGDLVPDEPTEATGEPITLGMVNQENTPGGSYPELSQAAQAAIDFVNEQLGGVDGRPIELEVCNTSFSAEGSTACGQRFVEEQVPAVLGGIDVFGTAIEVLADNGVPYVGGIPVSDQSVQAENSFQWSGGSWGATVAFAQHAIDELDAERVSIVYGEFGSIAQAAEYGRTVLERADVQTQMVPYPILSTDISSAVQAAVSTDPDAIFLLAADTGCKSGFDAMQTLGVTAQKYFVGACAAPSIIDSVDAEATNGTIFNVEGPVTSDDSSDQDNQLYSAVVERYADGLNPIGAGTVTFRAFMNLYSVLRGLGVEGVTPAGISSALASQVDTPSFMGHPYTCDREQFEGLPAMCSPQQILARIDEGVLDQLGSWIDVGAVYEG